MRQLFFTTTLLCVYINASAQAIPKKPSQLMYDIYRKTPVAVNFSDQTVDWNDTFVYDKVLELDLSNTNFNAIDLAKVGETFPNLEVLNLSHNEIFVFDDGFKKFPRLKTLDLSNNKLLALPVTSIHLVGLENLDLSNNLLQYYPENFQLFWTLKKLDVHGNTKLNQEELIEAFSEHNNLKKLIVDAPLISLAKIDLSETAISELYIWNAKPEQLNLFDGLDQLKKISLTNFTANSTRLISDFYAVKQLEIINSSFPGNTKEYINLKSISIKGVFDKELISTLIQLDSLELLGSGISNDDLIFLKTKLINTTILSDAGFESTNFHANQMQQIITPTVISSVISSEKAIEIKVEDIVFKVPENAFTKVDGTIFQGKVNFSVTPILDPITMALSGSPMYAIAGGEEGVFSSSGMFEVEAKDVVTGENLQPNPNKIIQVEMPNLNSTQKANLYYFNTLTKQWELKDNIDKTDAGLQKFIDSVMNVPVEKNTLIQKIVTNFYEGSLSDSDVRMTKVSFRLKQKSSYYRSLEEEFLTRKSWILDTILEDKQDSIFKRQMDGWEELVGFRKTVHKFEPIYFVKLIPDYEHDNYRFQYSYEGKKYEYPLRINVASDYSLSKNLKYVKDMERTRARFHVKDSINNFKTDSLINQQLRGVIQQYYLARQSSFSNFYLQQNDEKLSFGLTSFGIVNCDFFSREKPARMQAMGEVLTDQNDKQYETPENIRIVLPEYNTYTEVNKNLVPSYRTKKTIGIIILSALELGVFHLGENESIPSKIRSFSIKDLTPEQVREQILQE